MLQLFRRTRVRLTFVFTLLLLAIVSVASAAFWTVDYRYEYSTVDETLRSQADVVRQILSQTPASETIPQLPPGNPRGIAMDSIVIDGAGLVIAEDKPDQQTADLIQFGMSTGFPPHALLYSTTIRGSTFRVLLRSVVLSDGTPAGLVIARPIDEMLARLASVALLLIGGVAALVAVGGLLTWRLAGLALAPVRAMSATAREISEHDLHRRLKNDLPPDDEFGELAITFNAMLARLENAFDALQRFTADAAHELRAPLALMRAQVDVVLRRDRTPDEYRASHRALLEEIERLSRLADQLLLLARADAGVLQPTTETVDLPELLEGIVERWRPAAVAREVRLESDLPLEGEVRADPGLLRRLFDNLLDNALRHTPTRGTVLLSAVADDGVWRIVVDDTGPGVAPELRPHLFERFARGDPARGRETGGAGLGLSLSAAIADVHGGSIAIEEARSGHGARFVVTLPGAGAAPLLRL
jgi:heavy metal sensor kinase